MTRLTGIWKGGKRIGLENDAFGFGPAVFGIYVQLFKHSLDSQAHSQRKAFGNTGLALWPFVTSGLETWKTFEHNVTMSSLVPAFIKKYLNNYINYNNISLLTIRYLRSGESDIILSFMFFTS